MFSLYLSSLFLAYVVYYLVESSLNSRIVYHSHVHNNVNKYHGKNIYVNNYALNNFPVL